MKAYVQFLIVSWMVCWIVTNANAQTHVKLGTDDWPPYEFEQNGAITGYSTDVLTSVFKTMGIQIDSLKIYPWARAEEMVFTGELDALYSSSTGEKRLQYCYFPEEMLIESPWVMFIRKSDEGKLLFTALDDLKGKRVGVVRAYSYTPEFWDFLKKEQNYEEVPTDEINFKKLVNNRVDYIMSEYAVGLSLAKKLGLSDQVVALTDHPLKKTGLYIMFSKSTINEPFVKQFSDQLKQFKTTPEYANIYNKYMK